jgi:hypothetical protein
LEAAAAGDAEKKAEPSAAVAGAGGFGAVTAMDVDNSGIEAQLDDAAAAAAAVPVHGSSSPPLAAAAAAAHSTVAAEHGSIALVASSFSAEAATRQYAEPVEAAMPGCTQLQQQQQQHTPSASPSPAETLDTFTPRSNEQQQQQQQREEPSRSASMLGTGVSCAQLVPAAVTAVASGEANKVDERHNEQAEVTAAAQQQQHVGEAGTAAAVAGPGTAPAACEEQPPAAVLAATNRSTSSAVGVCEACWYGCPSDHALLCR